MKIVELLKCCLLWTTDGSTRAFNSELRWLTIEKVSQKGQSWAWFSESLNTFFRIEGSYAISHFHWGQFHCFTVKITELKQKKKNLNIRGSTGNLLFLCTVGGGWKI